MPKRESDEQPLLPIAEPGSAKVQEKIATLRKYYELGWRASGTGMLPVGWSMWYESRSRP